MITSKTNSLIKEIKSLSQKKERDEKSEFIVEGLKMVKEAIDAGLDIYKIIICDEIFKEKIEIENYDVEYIYQNIFEYISDTKSPQGIMAIVKKKEIANVKYGDTIFALDNIQDPGNLGTIIRTLDAVGIDNLLLSDGCADEYNSKVIRSTMGAIFRVNIQSNINLKEKLIELRENGYNIIVTALDADYNLFDYNFDGKNIIVIGNESNGVSREIQELATLKIKIPMIGQTESLNAGVAASIMAYEVLRKKM